MNLIPEWRDAWRFLSTQCNALGAAVVGSWQFLPPDFRAAIPDGWVLGMATALFVLGIVARVVPQPKAQAKIAARKAGES